VLGLVRTLARETVLQILDDCAAGSSQGLSVPVVLILNADKVPSFEGFADQGGRLSLVVLGVIESLDEFFDVVTVNNDSTETERFSARSIELEIVLEGGGLALSKPVDVKDGDQVVELVVATE